MKGFANTFMPGFNQFNPVALMVTGFYQLNRLVGSADLGRTYLLLGAYTPSTSWMCTMEIKENTL